MKLKEFLLLLIPVALVLAGLFMLFGPYALVGGGVALVVPWFLTDTEV